MAYVGIAWPGVTLALNVLRRYRGKEARKLAMVNEQPKLFKRPTDVRRRTEAAVAQYDAALKVLRDAERAMSAPPRKRRKLAEKPPVELIG